MVTTRVTDNSITLKVQVCHTCGDIGVENGPILQGTGVPAAHILAFLWKVFLVAFLQH